MTNSNSTATKNERWSATSGTSENYSYNIFASPKNTTTSKSDNLRQILRQDFGTPLFVSEQPLASHHSLKRPMRMASNTSFGSMSTISNTDSFASLNNQRFASVACSSKNNLLRYNNMDSRGSLLSLNNRWRATPSATNNSNAATSNQNNVFASLNMPARSGNHQMRWMATLDGDRASDQPMDMITRKSSSSYLFPASSA